MTSEDAMVDVVAALIWDRERLLICQRPANKARGLLWESVGGKVESGESKEQALIRECREELGVTLRVGDLCAEIIHEYPELTVRVSFFHAAIARGAPRKLEHNDIRWVTVEETCDYAFCPADEPVVEKLRALAGK